MVKCFVALVIFFCSVGNLFAQTETKVTINVDKVLIRTALERLQKETKVHFVYDEENIDQDKRVSLSYTQAPLKIVLEDFCKQTSLRYVVPERICHKMYMKSAYLNVSGTNLFTICSKKLKGQDPSQSGSSELINISVRPTYSLSLNVTF